MPAAEPCLRPIRLRNTGVVRGTGELASSLVAAGELAYDPTGTEALVSCGSRREDKCPACALVYARDARRVIRSGLARADSNPRSVVVFATLTAPSFGVPHHFAGKLENDGRPAPCWCRRRHTKEDTHIVGAPLDPDRHDYAAAVRWAFGCTDLWSATRTAWARAFPAFDVQVVRVVEAQRRGLPHFHCLFVVTPKHDGAPTPVGAFVAARLRDVALGVTATAPEGAVIRWGEQADFRPVPRKRAGDDRPGWFGASEYLIKYVTKSIGDSGPDGPPPGSPARRHLDQMRRAAQQLLTGMDLSPSDFFEWMQWRWYGQDLGASATLSVTPQVGNEPPRGVRRYGPAHLRRVVDALGYRGHALAKTMGWGLTFKEVRDLRRQHLLGDEEPVRWVWKWVEQEDYRPAVQASCADPHGPPS